MKTRLRLYIESFLDKRSKNWQQRMCLITFMMLSLSMVVVGVPMHIAGIIGRGETALYAVSAVTWTSITVVLALFLLQRMSLNVAVSMFGIITQLAESIRIVYAAIYQPSGFEEIIVFNQVISLALIIYLVMATVKNIPTLITSISIGTLLFAYFYTDGGVNEQVVLIFVVAEVFTCILGKLIRRGIRSMQRENDDYHNTINRLLNAFHMTKTELLAYIQLGRGGMEHKDISDFFDHLDERTEANLIRAVSQRIAERKMKNADFLTALPMLTPTEQEVCRLIVGGKSLLEIADILNKSSNNIGTVRIHIRKKLGLDKGEDLRDALLRIIEK